MKETFRDLIAANKRKSLLLIAGFIVFTLLLAALLGTAVVLLADPDTDPAAAARLGLFAGGATAVISLGLMAMGYFSGDQFILSVSGARPLAKEQDPQLYNVVEEMAIAAGVPMPNVYLINDDAMNAFATGRDPAHASVAITRGLRSKLNREELEGVIAHEMSHVRNYDIRLMLLVTVLVGSIVMLTDLFWRILRYGPRSSRSGSGDRDSKGSGPWLLIILVLAILLAIIAPILAHIIQMAVSRQREYLADASGVELTRNPHGLASALRKLEADPTPLRDANRGTAHLYIVNPIKRFQDWSETLFASHPPIKDRIARLEGLVGG